MQAYTVELPEGEERGIRIACREHGSQREFQPGYRTVTFHCEQCGYELEVDLRRLDEWRDLGEMC